MKALWALKKRAAAMAWLAWARHGLAFGRGRAAEACARLWG